MGLLPSSKLLCDAPHRASSDAERPRHLQDTHTLRKLPSHLPFGRAVYLRPAELHALGDGALETCLYPLANHRPLEFRKGASYLENELAHGCRRVDGLLVQVTRRMPRGVACALPQRYFAKSVTAITDSC